MLEKALKNFNEKQFNEIKQLFQERNHREVVSHCLKYLGKDPKNAWANLYMGLSLWYTGGKKERALAVDYLNNAIELSNDDPEIYANVGLIYLDNVISRSVAHFQKALSINPNLALAHYGMGVALFSLGQIEFGIDLILKAVGLEDNLKFLEDLIHYIYYDPRFRNPQYKQIAELYPKVAKAKYKITPYKHSKERYDSKKTNLRIGFYNGEHLGTPTWPFLERILKHFNKELFSIYCYANTVRKISLTEEHSNITQIKKYIKKFTYCSQMKGNEIAELILQDEIDILVDLSGYLPSIYSFTSLDPAINVFLYKAAPVQITWYGFWGTTGISEIDYLLTSEDNVPPSQDHNFTEKVYRLTKGYTHAEIFDDLPDIDPIPAFEKNGYVTFTSFSRVTKLSTHTFYLWSEILKRVPNSKILIKYQFLEAEIIENFIKTNFSKRGIDPNRILLEVEREAPIKFIAAYNKTDIALEPVPFGGVTTTINAITMGIPVICKAEEDRSQCGGSVSLLRAIDCQDLAAFTDEEYINNAVNLANNFEKLREYKSTLRNKIENSSITAKEYAKDLEKAFSDIWQDCCQSFEISSQKTLESVNHEN